MIGLDLPLAYLHHCISSPHSVKIHKKPDIYVTDEIVIQDIVRERAVIRVPCSMPPGPEISQDYIPSGVIFI